MKISVAMTTYNGEKYILKQLLSIKNQTLKVDEVIICDDISSDETVNIINKFVSEYKLFNWKVITNDKNLGWKRNFRKAISMTSGDIIFFSDQDDIWYDNKIEIMSKKMIQYDMGCLFGKCDFIDEGDNIIRSREEQKKYLNDVKKIEFSNSFYTVGGLGCCMCVSRNIINKYLQYNCLTDDHDSQCPRIAVIYDSLWQLDLKVIKYRLHENNTSQISSKMSFGQSSLDRRIDGIRTVNIWMERALHDSDIAKERKRIIKDTINFQIKRLAYFDSQRNFLSLIKERKRYSGISMLIGDYAYKHGINTFLGKIRWKIKKVVNR